MDILKALKEIPISLELLQKTRIGMLVNNVRKQTTSDEVSGMAKQLIKGWKKLVPGNFYCYIMSTCSPKGLACLVLVGTFNNWLLL